MLIAKPLLLGLVVQRLALLRLVAHKAALVVRRVGVRSVDRRRVTLSQEVAHPVLVACLLLARLPLLQLVVGRLQGVLLLYMLL